MIGAAPELEGRADIQAVWDYTVATLTSAGLPHVIYISVDAQGGNPFVLTNAQDVYAAADPTDDPFLSHICTSYAIMPTGPAFLPDYDYLPPAAQSFIRAARATGWETGIGLPMRLQGSDRYGGFNIGCGLDRATFEADILPRAEDFRFFCLLAHRRIEELSGSGAVLSADGFRDLLVAPQSAELATLSPREREVVYLVARGLSRKECARICGISPNTVADYTKSAYRKLGVSNRAEAANRLLSARS